jgi:hypothetical protein
MSAPFVFPSDVQVLGTLTAFQINVPLGAIVDSMISGSANIAATKVQKQFQENYTNADSATTAVSETRVIHAVRGATGTLVEFAAGAVVPLVGADTCTLDLLKNGTTMLAAPISLLNTDTARLIKFAGLASNTLVAGDVLEVRVSPTHTSGTLPKGVFARVTVREDAP